MKNVIYLFVALFAFSACTSNGTKEKTTEAPAKKIDCICLWDGAALRENPKKKGKYISGVSLGEKVAFLGERQVDSADRNREYIKIELSDGTTGWSTAILFAEDAYVAAISESATIYKRPDILTATSEKFEKMDIIAVSNAKDDWIEVMGVEKKQKGWIKKQSIVTGSEDVALCVMVEKKLKNKGQIAEDKLEEFLTETPYKNSAFIEYLQELLDESTIEEVETVAKQDTAI